MRHEFDERENGKGSHFHYPSLWSPGRSTVVYVEDVAIGITIFEVTEEVEVRREGDKYVRVVDQPTAKRSRQHYVRAWTHTEYMPSGRFCIQAYSPYRNTEWALQWREAKPGELIFRLSNIERTLRQAATTIAQLADAAKKKAELERQRWHEECERWRVEEMKRRQALAITESTAELKATIQAWGEARLTASFLDEIEKSIVDLDDHTRNEVSARLIQARQLLGETSPLRLFMAWRPPEEHP